MIDLILRLCSAIVLVSLISVIGSMTMGGLGFISSRVGRFLLGFVLGLSVVFFVFIISGLLVSLYWSIFGG